MYTINDNNTKYPINIWLSDNEMPEDSCMEQANRLADLPFVFKWVNLMPDTHAGVGMPIGGVFASKDAVIPNAVGKDIGCGMAFAGTNIKLSDVENIETGNGVLIQAIVGDILRNIPVGFAHQTEKQYSTCLDEALEKGMQEDNKILAPEIEAAYFQKGTLGGGNHFIEIQIDEDGYLGIMLHSGSRHFGSKVCDYFNSLAKDLNAKWKSDVPYNSGLAFLPLYVKEGQQYMEWMNLALDFGRENRAAMLLKVKDIFAHWVEKYAKHTVKFTDEINCHHNYAAMENHYGKNVLVHRKGAIRAREGELGLIPGAMGSYSYVVKGKGEPKSFNSSAHGAGRKYTRRGAIEAHSVEEVMVDLKDKNVYLGKHNKEDVAGESRFAYKNIDDVMENQKDLIEPVKKLKTVGVVKG